MRVEFVYHSLDMVDEPGGQSRSRSAGVGGRRIHVERGVAAGRVHLATVSSGRRRREPELPLVEGPRPLLVAAGDNPDRLRSEAAFALLCGVAPLEASSGKTVRHRLNRGGNRQANKALYHVVIRAWHPTRRPRSTSPATSRGQVDR